MTKWYGVSLLVAVLVASGTVSAQDASGQEVSPAQAPAIEEVDVEEVDGLQVILEQQTELRSDLDKGGIDGLTTRENNRVRKAQQEVFAVTEGKSRLDDLSIDDKVRLENALEQINALVKDTRLASDDQTVCWRERQTGTKMKVTRCGTQAEIREAREGARGFLDRPRTCGEACGSQ